MKFSFVIPALNEEGYIELCLKSIKAQSEKPYEIIVVDNGSIDRTSEIAKKLGCKVVSERKRGISHARNKGAKVAKGDILCFVDADGILSRNWLKEAKNSLSNKKVQAVDGLIVFSHENLLKNIMYNSWTVIAYSGILFSKLLLGKHIFTGNNMAIRRKVFESLGGFEPYVGEQFLLSKRFWTLPNNRAELNPKMVVRQSPRRFENKGFLSTVLYWIKSGVTKISHKDYNYRQA